MSCFYRHIGWRRDRQGSAKTVLKRPNYSRGYAYKLQLTSYDLALSFLKSWHSYMDFQTCPLHKHKSKDDRILRHKPCASFATCSAC